MMRDAFSMALGRPDAPFHVAAHSHHPWPDVSFAAHGAYWQDSARLLDRKWEHILGTVKPAVARHVAREIGLSDPATVTFAPNTHGLVCAILSCLDGPPPLRVLTTDAEFHSFARQCARLEEDGLLEVTRVPAQPFETVKDRIIEALAREQRFDLVYLSHVFFNSGYSLTDAELGEIAGAIPDASTYLVIDGYHSFMARPVDFSSLQARAFYLSGGYKYAMAGEGVCFLHAPPGYGARPRMTGWYAAFSALSGTQGGRVPYAEDAARFDGATYDPSGLYRLRAVMDWLEREGLTTGGISAHVQTLQTAFLAQLGEGIGALRRSGLLVEPDTGRCGRFVTFETPEAETLFGALGARNVITDYRNDRLRLGFGLYHEAEDVARLIDHLKAIV